MHVSLLDSGYLQLGKLTLAEYQYAKYLRKMAYTYLIMRGKAYYQLQFPSPFHLNKRGSFVTSLSNKLLSKYRLAEWNSVPVPRSCLLNLT